MSEKIFTLQAEIEANIKAIEDAYGVLHKATMPELDEQSTILVGYYLHVLYGLFENVFVRIASAFGNHIEDASQWHSQLLWRMTLDIKGLRPAVISQELYAHLNELRRFRHLFRNAYLLHFDPVRLNLVLQNAQQAEQLYKQEIEQFQTFLNTLIDDV